MQGLEADLSVFENDIVVGGDLLCGLSEVEEGANGLARTHDFRARTMEFVTR